MENEAGYLQANAHFFSRQPMMLQEDPVPYPTREELHDRSSLR